MRFISKPNRLFSTNIQVLKKVPNCAVCEYYNHKNYSCKKYEYSLNDFSSKETTFKKASLVRRDEDKCGFEGKGFEYIDTQKEFLNKKISFFSFATLFMPFLGVTSLNNSIAHICIQISCITGVYTGFLVTKKIFYENPDKYILVKSDHDNNNNHNSISSNNNKI
jgi:hypothetical protein